MNRSRIRTAISLIALVILVVVAKFGSNGKASPPAEPPVQTGQTQSAPKQEATTPAAVTANDPLASVAADSAEREQIEVTLRLIASNGPFPHQRDGIVFNNREGRLPGKPRGYYHEYTVETPGASTRGARRVIRGDGGETYYTRDHYASFVRIDEGGPGDR